MSTRGDTVFGDLGSFGVSDAWFESLSQAEPSISDEESVRSRTNPSRRSFSRDNSFGLGGQHTPAGRSAVNRQLPRAIEYATHQNPRNSSALEGNAILNITITGTLHPASQQHVNAAPQQDYSKYTSLLKEFGDTYSETPTYEQEDIGTTLNPSFRCVVTFRGITATGTGRNRKLAKHEASFRACQRLGLRL